MAFDITRYIARLVDTKDAVIENRRAEALAVSNSRELGYGWVWAAHRIHHLPIANIERDVESMAPANITERQFRLGAVKATVDIRELMMLGLLKDIPQPFRQLDTEASFAPFGQ